MKLWGDDIRIWFELFSGMAVHRGGQPSVEGETWLNIDDLEFRFRIQKLNFDGQPYDPKNVDSKNRLYDAIISQAGMFCHLKILERRRQMSPPSLDYRITRIGRKIDNWGYGSNPGFKKRAFFFLASLYLRGRKHWKFVVIGAAGWALLNAVRFYTVAFEWVQKDLFSLISAVLMVVFLWISSLVVSK